MEPIGTTYSGINPAMAGRYGGRAAEAGTPVAADGSQTATAEGVGGKQTPQVQQEIVRLRATEEKVKAHEAAHKTVGGAATGPVSYTYTRGPDGKQYISGGEVPISISAGSTPTETISRMDQVIRAALAPADPSPQDRAVASQAANLQQKARQEESQAADSSASGAVTSASGSDPLAIQPGGAASQAAQPATAATANTARNKENAALAAYQAAGRSSHPSPPASTFSLFA